MNIVPFLLTFSLTFHAQADTNGIQPVNTQLAQLKADAINLNSQNCDQRIAAATAAFADWMPSDPESLKLSGPALLQALFEIRLAWHARLEFLPMECVAKMKDLFRNLRAASDIVGVYAYNDTQIRAEDIQFPQQAVPIHEADKYHPYFTSQTPFEFKKGDLIISKGVTMTSSMISSITRPSSLFSHIVFAYQDPQTQEWGTIESYIGKGVDFYPLKTALLNENARLLVLRAKDQNVALLAHDYMVERVRKSFADKQKIAYDYVQDFDDNSRLTCEEIAYDAYRTASQGKMQIPLVPSIIDIKDPIFAQSIGLKNGPMMIPADLEVDPRFEIVLDWTDYRLMRDSWRKDALASEIVRWINEENYVMQDSYRASFAKLLWKARKLSWLWPALAKISGIPKDFAADVPPEGIAALANLDTLATSLLPRLERLDEEQFKKNRQWMSQSQLRKALNQLRLEDQARYRPPITFSDFHYFFKPQK